MKINNFDISISELDNEVIAINFDKNGKEGGYISIKLDDEGIVVDIFNSLGDVIGSTWTLYNELDPQEEITQ